MANVEFKSYIEALRYCEKEAVIYLPEHIGEIQEFLPYLRPLPEGLYLPKTHKPFLTLNNGLFWKTRDSKITPILSLDEIIETKKADIVDCYGDLVLSHSQLNGRAGLYLRSKPDPDAVLYRALISIIYEYFNCRSKNSSLPGPEYQIKTLFIHDTPRSVWDLSDSLYCSAQWLIDSLNEFYADEFCKTHTVRVKDIEVYIEKGLDYRILKYYELTANDLDRSDESE